MTSASAPVVAAHRAGLVQAMPARPVQHHLRWGQDAHNQPVDELTRTRTHAYWGYTLRCRSQATVYRRMLPFPCLLLSSQSLKGNTLGIGCPYSLSNHIRKKEHMIRQFGIRLFVAL
jgi:hypothetical protein